MSAGEPHTVLADRRVAPRPAAQRPAVPCQTPRVDGAEARRGQRDEHGRVLGHAVGHAVAASEAGGDHVVGVLIAVARLRAVRRSATQPTSPRIRHGCATRSIAGPRSTAPRPDAGCTGRPPARRRTSCSPPTLECLGVLPERAHQPDRARRWRAAESRQWRGRCAARRDRGARPPGACVTSQPECPPRIHVTIRQICSGAGLAEGPRRIPPKHHPKRVISLQAVPGYAADGIVVRRAEPGGKARSA